MIIPKLTDSWESFRTKTNIRPLKDVLTITVTEVLNDVFDLYLEYPEEGQFAAEIEAASESRAYAAVIEAQPRAGSQTEPFIVYKVERSIDKIKRVKAHSAIYQRTMKITEAPFAATGITATIAALNLGDIEIVNVDITDETTVFELETPASLWETIGLIAGKFKAELKYTYDAYDRRMNVELYKRRGRINKDIVISEGVNVIDYRETTNSENRISEVLGYVQGEDQNGNYTTVSVVVATGVPGDGKTLIVDFQREFDGLPTHAALLVKVSNFVAQLMQTDDAYGTYTADVDFVPLGNTTEHDGKQDPCEVGDTVPVNILGKYISERVVQTVYNCFTGKYEQIVTGSMPVTIADTIAELERKQADLYRNRM